MHRREIDGFKLARASSLPDLNDPCGDNFCYRDLIECGETQAATGIENLPRQTASFNALYDLTVNVLDPVID